jgi:hypothetical protein
MEASAASGIKAGTEAEDISRHQSGSERFKVSI